MIRRISLRKLLSFSLMPSIACTCLGWVKINQTLQYLLNKKLYLFIKDSFHFGNIGLKLEFTVQVYLIMVLIEKIKNSIQVEILLLKLMLGLKKLLTNTKTKWNLIFNNIKFLIVMKTISCKKACLLRKNIKNMNK